MAYARAKSRPQDTVIICPGVRDMLNVDNHTGESTLRHLTVENMTDHITALLKEGGVNFHVAYPQSHIVTTVPLDVSYGGAKPLGPSLGPLTSFPGV